MNFDLTINFQKLNSQNISEQKYKAMPWLRLSVTSLSLLRPRLTPGSVHKGFVALEQVLIQVLWFSPCQYHSTMALHTHISPGGRTMALSVATVQR
jgi:hypothetical protein